MSLPGSTILLLENDIAFGQTIHGILSRTGYQVTVVEDADEAFRRAGDHQLMVIDVVTGAKAAQEICREIRATQSLAGVAVLCIAQSEDVEERVRFLEAGADDVMAKPFDARELEARVEALMVRFQHRSDLTPVTMPGAVAPKGHTVVLCFSPKGGVGTTTIAVNVAVALANGRPGSVVLVDLDLQWGQVATHLNLRPTLTLAELSRDEPALAEPELLRTYALRHESGLDVICAPLRPDQASLLGAEQIERVVRGAATLFDVVVIDGGSTFDDRTMAVIGLADSVLFTIYPEIAALKALTSLLELLAEQGRVGRTLFLVNHLFAREMLKVRDIENTLAAKVELELPYEPIVYLKAVNEGVPVVRGAPRSEPAERLRRLAGLLVGGTPTPAASAPEPKRGLGGFLHRS